MTNWEAVRLGLSTTVLALALSGAWTECVAAAIALPSVRDNTLFESATGALSNGAGPAVYAGDNAGLNTRRALFFFDVAGHVPAGSIVMKAELRLHVSSVPLTESHSIDVHRVLADWGEGSSYSAGGSGALAQPGDATWIHRFFPNLLWVAAGGDFVEAPSASAAVADTGSYVWSGPQLVADVQSWIDDPASEFGWMLIGDEGVTQSVRRIDSREAAEVAVRPELWIEVGTIAVTPQSWGRTKASYRW